MDGVDLHGGFGVRRVEGFTFDDPVTWVSASKGDALHVRPVFTLEPSVAINTVGDKTYIVNK